MSVYHAFTQFFPLKQVTKESGPPHMKSFVTKVSVGEFMGEGEGKSKKISKKNAAIAVLEELKKLPPLPTVEKMKPRIKKKTKSIVKVRDRQIGNLAVTSNQQMRGISEFNTLQLLSAQQQPGAFQTNARIVCSPSKWDSDTTFTPVISKLKMKEKP